MKIEPIVVDFETGGIERRPDYPPVPVGFSLYMPNERKPTYHAWGHPVGNNTTKKAAQSILKDAWRQASATRPLLFHHGKFDVDVAETHMGVKRLPWNYYHDTLYLLFLRNPHALSLGLKQSAEDILGMEPEERDVVRDWLEEHGVVRKKQKDWGAHICKAPGTLVGPYANGDVIRTKKLFMAVYPEIVKRGMLEAYDRERRLMPILLDNERAGINVDIKRLDSDIILFEKEILRADEWLRKRLKAKDLNIDSDNDLADALDRAKIVTDWVYTAPSKTHPEGQRSVAKKNMTVDMFRDKKVASVLGYRNRASTCLGTFMRPWQEMARESGRIYTNWNQVRQAHGNDGFAGARTGRLSSNPNFQNIPKTFEDKDDGYVHPTVMEFTPLPRMRRYILPDKGGVIGHRDYNQQELRILGHFEDDKLCQAYNDDPRLDVHTYVQQAIKDILHLEINRSSTKILNFGMIYGMGLGKLADGTKSTVEEAKKLKNAQLEALPGLKALNKGITELSKSGQPIRTWGGREYYVEEPMFINGRRQTFEYKLLNYLIQGSAADCSKQSVINYHEIKKEGRFLITVHDENNISCPKGAIKREMAILREAMESVKFDVPMLSDGKTGPNWGELVKFVEK